MIYFVILLAMLCIFSFMLANPTHAEEKKQFHVNTKMTFPESIPAGKPVDFTIDVTYNGPYSWVKNLEPKFEIVPSRADYDVDIWYDDSISDYTIWKGHIHRLHGTMLVSEDTLFESVFLSVSFEGMIRFDEEVVSVDPDSTISLNIGESAQESEPENQFHEGYVEWISRCFMVGSDVVLRVTDPDMNRDSELVEEINVTMWSDNDYRNVAYVLIETGKNTGIFDANVFFTTTDSSPGKRLRIVDGSTVYAKYVDYISSEPYKAIDVINSVATGLSVLERNTDGSISKIDYDPCALEILMQNPDRLEQIDVFYPPPLKQIKSGIPTDEIQCKNGLVQVFKKSDKTPACVTLETKEKLIERSWMKDDAWTAKYDKSNPTVIILPGAVIEGNKALDPKVITVVLGINNTVSWINGDDVAHALSSDYENNAWWTGLLKPGESSSVTFNNTGIFSFHGTPGPWISGTVVVLPGDPAESDAPVLKYSPVMFSGTGVDLSEDDLIEHLKNKREQLDIAFDEIGAKRLYSLTGMSFSMGNNAYSLDEKYVGSPLALEIRVLKEEFTRETLEEINQLVRKYIGDEIDIVYSKGVYAFPAPMMDE